MASEARQAKAAPASRSLMHISDILSRHRVSCSFEFFPPKTESAAQSLFETVSQLESLAPSFVSVTYGAGGSTRELTHNLVVKLKRETSLEPVPHLTCVGHDRTELQGIIEGYRAAGIDNLLALGGDPPRNAPAPTPARDGFTHAADLVEFARTLPSQAPQPTLGIGVAGYPEGHPATPNRLLEMDYLKEKVDRGADFIVTQLFFDNRDFYDFRDRCALAGIHVPILAGIMPVASEAGVRRMAGLALGTRIPAALQRAIARCDSDASVARLGVHWATQQCLDLLDHGVQGLHFYTLNRSLATLEIYRNLGATDSAALSY